MSSDATPDCGSVRRAWEANAAWWDAHVGAEGNEFHRLLVAPAQLRLLDLKAGERVVEFGCGNGQFAREMARAGARVVASDFSAAFVEIARRHSVDACLGEIEFHVADATDEAQLLRLGEAASFDAAVCTMAIHDIETIEPLMRAVRALLKPDGRFVFSVTHPAFNHSGVVFQNETEDCGGDVVVRYSIRMSAYLGGGPARGVGIIGQPEPHWYFDRTLTELLRPAFAAGLVVDGMEEPAFPPGLGRPGRPQSWTNYPGIPPVLVVRLRPFPEG